MSKGLLYIQEKASSTVPPTKEQMAFLDSWITK